MNSSALLLIFASLFSKPLMAQYQDENCMRAPKFGDYRDLIHKVGVVDEAGRMTEEEYATKKSVPLKAVQNRFAATGKLTCGDKVLSAQLTGCNNVITTAAHTFVDLETCKNKAVPTACTYTTKIGNVEQVSKVKNTKKIGTSCPAKPEAFEDWSVLEIEPVSKDVEPYDLPANREVAKGDDVVSVSAGARDFTRLNKKTNEREMVKTIEECKIKDVLVYLTPAIFDSNCDFAQGNSGGSVVSRINGRDVLVGISISSYETPAMIDKAVRTGKVNAAPYQAGKWLTRHVPLNDDFLKAVKSACDGQSI